MNVSSWLTEDADVLARLRTWLLAMLGAGMIGTAAELLLLGHFETVTQQLPVALLALGVAIAAWQAVRPAATPVRALRATMLLFVAAGVIGIGLHYDGNTEFELEMYPTMRGFELVQKTLTGATPVLAPGSMMLLGFIGLAYTYRHPCLMER